ncbi:MAG TPA: EF-hand domain-containing protein [Candidatus Gastranaerophilales bacterium]|nr:EF-hand domain-containing protein [Candidatus Gastranaerophilales bacterium]
MQNNEEKQCRNINGKLLCNYNDLYEERLNDIADICSKQEFTVRELFKAFDVDGDGAITKSDLIKLAGSDEEKKHLSRNDLQNIYAHIGKKICRGVCQIIDKEPGNEYITIDDLINVLDKNGDGKIKLGDFLRIAKKDGNFLNITKEELESEFDGLWKNPEEQKTFFDKLFD